MAIRETGALCDEGEDIIMEFNHGVLFSDTYQKKLKSQFYYADKDPQYGARLFFENSGGSLRLKKAVEAKAAIEEFPDCPERARGRGFDLADYVKNGTQEILEVIFGAKSGALITELTASQTMFHAVGTIMEGVRMRLHLHWSIRLHTMQLSTTAKRQEESSVRFRLIK